jgi:hypothetical protein
VADQRGGRAAAVVRVGHHARVRVVRALRADRRDEQHGARDEDARLHDGQQAVDEVDELLRRGLSDGVTAPPLGDRPNVGRPCHGRHARRRSCEPLARHPPTV